MTGSKPRSRRWWAFVSSRTSARASAPRALSALQDLHPGRPRRSGHQQHLSRPPLEFVAQLATVDRHGPAGQVDVQGLVDVDLSSPPSRWTVTGESPPRSTCATAAPLAPGAATTASPPRRARRSARGSRPAPVSRQNETFVRFGKIGGVLDLRADRAAGRARRGPRRGSRTAGCRSRRAGSGSRRPRRVAVRRAARDSSGEVQAGAAHVDAAGRRAGDRRPDLARERLDRERVLAPSSARRR